MGKTAEQKLGSITLRGSVDTVVEFFGFAVNSILYQRGVYPNESFKTVRKYGLPMLVTTDVALDGYLAEVLKQLNGWMCRCEVRKLVIAVASKATGDTLERWAFDVHLEGADADAKAAEAAAATVAVPQSQADLVKVQPQSQADLVKVQKDIQAIIRQICASVTFLPLLDEPCTFDLLVYTDKEAEVPIAWGETDPKYIVGGCSEVKLRSFTTKIHKVEGSVAYKFDECGA